MAKRLLDIMRGKHNSKDLDRKAKLLSKASGGCKEVVEKHFRGISVHGS